MDLSLNEYAWPFISARLSYNRSSLYRLLTDHTENLFHTCSDMLQRNGLATIRNIRYNNELPIVVMQY
jgi:hypothetical protein